MIVIGPNALSSPTLRLPARLSVLIWSFVSIIYKRQGSGWEFVIPKCYSFQFLSCGLYIVNYFIVLDICVITDTRYNVFTLKSFTISSFQLWSDVYLYRLPLSFVLSFKNKFKVEPLRSFLYSEFIYLSCLLFILYTIVVLLRFTYWVFLSK